MNDCHPSGSHSPTASPTDASYQVYSPYGQGGTATSWSAPHALSSDDDPLFGPLPGDYSAGYGPGTTSHGDGGADFGYPAAPLYPDGGVSAYHSGAPVADATALDATAFAYGAYDPGLYGGGTHEMTAAYGVVPPDSVAPGYDTGVYGYDESAGAATAGMVSDDQQPYGGYPATGQHLAEGGHTASMAAPQGEEGDPYDAGPTPERHESESDSGSQAGYPPEHDQEPDTSSDPRTGRGRQSSGHASIRNRRRKATKRSALLTVAVPSVAVMGVAAVAAATVVSPESGGKDNTRESQPENVTTVASTKLDRQLAGLTADADDFADRASRTQERIDLRERQAAEKRRKELEAKRKEALRPKFALPVSAKGLSAQYGQAGINWMSLHTGIDFPVSHGTPVMAATDGVVSTKWGGAYGNMAIVTHADGTETWYCHLSSTKIRTGPVKAGDVIAYSGNSGNSTGPHLHFEVHPGGGVAVDPLQWLVSKGLDPR